MGGVAPRVLMVAHGFPPASGSGANRALAFARYLPAFGWRPVVLTPCGEWAAHSDDHLLKEVPTYIKVVRTRSLEPRPGPSVWEAPAHGKPATPGRLRRQLGHLKRFPDAHVGWLPHAVAAARGVAFDLIYTTSGPFTSHLVGLALSRLTGKPWVAELRDGWHVWNRAIFPDYPRWRDALESRLEASVFRSARRVILVTERMADAFRAQYRNLPASHFAVVTNGFDPSQFCSGNSFLDVSDSETPSQRASGPSRLEIVHAGALYYGRGLTSVLDALATLNDPPHLTLVGTLDQTARNEIARHPSAQHVDFLGYLDHAQTIARMRQADLLLLVANTTEGAEATVPGKLFEYLAVGRPILAVAPPYSSTADVVGETRAGWLAASDDAQAIADAMSAFQSGQRPTPDRAAISRYDRRALAGHLARLFDDVLAARRL